MKKRWWIIPLAALLLLLAAFFVFTLSCRHAEEIAWEALESDTVTVEETDFGWRFDGPSDDAVLIF